MLCFTYSSSGFAQTNNYLIGVGIYDVTGQIAESNFGGYAQLLHRNNGIRDRQYARAYVMQEPNGSPVVFVCIDKWATTQSVNLAVIQKLKARFGNLYTDENVIISATHVHVSPGGYSHYGLYNTSTGGYWTDNFNTLVNGIFHAIERAHNNRAPGRIYYNTGTLTNASINRSLVAYNRNTDASQYNSIDEEMTILKLIQGNQEVGMISWFAVHPTSLTKNYKLCSGDSKGNAALAFERLKNSSYGTSNTFVAAFANTNAGDMSPNLNLPPAGNHTQDATGPGSNEEESADIIGQRQFSKALELYNTANTQLTGSIQAVARYSDFSNLLVAPEFTGGTYQNTCRAALGISFMAGAEDGRSGISREGITKPADYGLAIDRCHAEKPIAPFFFIGSNDNNPATPKILPTTLMKIGQLGILAAPAEFTVMAGRRAKATIKSVAGTGLTHLVFAGYSDAYAGYVTTREEYASQQYEGASTHFGPWTLAAYRQEFKRLAIKMINPSANPWPNPAPTPPNKSAPLDVSAHIFFDDTPSYWTTKKFGFITLPVLRKRGFGDVHQDANSTYQKGSTASVTFWGAHPNNDLKTNGTYLAIERWNGQSWQAVLYDRHPETKLTWARNGVANSLVTVKWNIPTNASSGYYRIRHFGKWKNGWNGNLSDYSGSSRSFIVN
ncbi:hypothetical protein BKI52_11785 [marine bacterium AO1-C]|nr:hypothetical protein BKI52_11785 [marine bacterium AO1-C]